MASITEELGANRCLQNASNGYRTRDHPGSKQENMSHRAVTTTARPPLDQVSEHMPHRAVLEALSGLLLSLFVAMLSSTIVSNALPRIVADLKGTQSGYTWVVVATLLTMTASKSLRIRDSEFSPW